MAEAEPPRLLVVRGAVGNPIRKVGQRVQVFLQLGQRYPFPDRNAVVDDVKIRLLEVDDPFALRVLHEGVADVPLLGDRPVEDLGAAGDFANHERNVLGNMSQGLAETAAGDAAANGVEFGDEPVHPLAGTLKVDGFEQVVQAHGVSGRTVGARGVLGPGKRRPGRVARSLTLLR